MAEWFKEVRSVVLPKANLKPESFSKAINWEHLARKALEILGPIERDVFKAAAAERFRKQDYEEAERMDAVGQAANAYIKVQTARMVVEISAETRQAIEAIVSEAFNHGYGAAKTARLLRAVVGLTDKLGAAVGNYYSTLLARGLADEVALRRMERYANRLLNYRTEMIARTEVNNAARKGIIEAYKQQEVELLDRVGDPQACEICVEANSASPYTPDEAAEVSDLHPNDECTFVIHVGGS
jgi:hypothetical protein